MARECRPACIIHVLAPLIAFLVVPVLQARSECSFAWQQNLPSTFGIVWSAAIWDDGSGAGPKLYTCGELSFNGGPNNNVIRWDGDHWTPVGGSFDHTSGSYTIVHALAIYNGELIAAGDFTLVGGVFMDHIARWDGFSWRPLGTGSHEVIYAMTTFNGELAVGGEPNNPPMIWNGANWRFAGCCVASGPVKALTVYNGQLVAGGEMGSPESLAVLDGNTWKVLGGGVNGYVYALGTYNGELIVGGTFTQAGGVPARGVARWNGVNWAPLGSGVSSVTGLHWVGAFTTHDSKLIAGGRFNLAGGVSANYVAQWNGSAWSALGAGLPMGHSDAEVKGLGSLNGMLAASGFLGQFPGGSDTQYWALFAGEPGCGACDDNAQCDDLQFCNGLETCAEGTCQAGASPCAAPLRCRESDDQCVSCLSDADCGDGVFCNGTETCSAAGTCQAGASPCAAPLLCRESDDRCVSCLTNAHCDDGLFCNGAEMCGAGGTCQAGSNPCPGGTCDENANMCMGGAEVWMSFVDAASVPGAGTVAAQDIVARNASTGGWSIVFDGSDVGLGNLVIDGMARMTDGSILLSFTAAASIPGMTGGPSGTTLDDSDIVRFVPTSLGGNTAGSFVFYFDGSDVGLTTDAEDIDAIALTGSGQLIISTLGAVSANGASGADTDLLRFNAMSLGSVTSGSFVVHFDGSDVGLGDNGPEDVDAVAIRSNGTLLLSTLGNFAVPGLSGADEDLVQFTPSVLGATTSGTYAMYLDLSARGIATSENVGSVEFKE